MEIAVADRFSSEHLCVLELIGKGTYGEVFLGVDKRSGEKVAIKKMIKHEEDDGMAMENTLKEIKMLQSMKHENVVKLREVVIIRKEMGLVFEYMENDLHGLLARPNTKFSVPQIKCYLRQLLLGVHYLHINKIIHRDIKPSNILVNNAGQLKLADFGIATVKEDYDHQPMSSNVVTLWYRAPELLLGSEHYGNAIDMWAVGCVFAEMLLRRPILPGKNEQDQVNMILDLCGTPNWSGVSSLPNFGKFVRNFRPSRVRETFKRLDSKALDLLERMLTLDPARRATAFEALDSDYLWTDPMPCDPVTLPKHMPMNEYKAMVQRAEQSRLEQERRRQSRLEQERRRQSRLEQERRRQSRLEQEQFSSEQERMRQSRLERCLPQAYFTRKRQAQFMYEPRKRQCLPWMRTRHQNACIK